MVKNKGSKARQKDRLRLLEHKRSARNRNGKKNARKTRKKIRKKAYEENANDIMVVQNKLKAPTVFNLRKNHEEMIHFYDELRDAISKKKRTMILMEDITEVNVGSILYLVAIIEDAQKKRVLIRGNFPKDRQCASIIQASGFFDYVRPTSPLPVQRRMKISRITFHHKHDPQDITELCRFTCSSIGKPLDEDADPLYATLSELVQNTITHAYKENTGRGNWYVAAQHLQEENKVEITFLDTGAGIPFTVKKRFMEKLPFIGKSDEELIMSALKGEFRTSTGKEYRGKGLPEIYDYYRNGFLLELAIASGTGYIYGKNMIHLENAFIGTLFSFKIGKDGNG